jgi:hypothetical protein
MIDKQNNDNSDSLMSAAGEAIVKNSAVNRCWGVDAGTTSG